MDSAIIGSLARHIVTFLGGVLVIRGDATQEQVEQIAGAAMTLVAVGWSVWHKIQAARAVRAAGQTQGTPEA